MDICNSLKQYGYISLLTNLGLPKYSFEAREIVVQLRSDHVPMGKCPYWEKEHLLSVWNPLICDENVYCAVRCLKTVLEEAQSVEDGYRKEKSKLTCRAVKSIEVKMGKALEKIALVPHSFPYVVNDRSAFFESLDYTVFEGTTFKDRMERVRFSYTLPDLSSVGGHNRGCAFENTGLL